MNEQNTIILFKDLGYKAIAKHAQKIFKYETSVIKDQDPENLHQMRVGVRRLRSAIADLAIALNLPATVTDKNLGKIGKSLGKLRDLDVLMMGLNDYYRPQLPKKEQKHLDQAIVSLHKQRKHKLQQVKKTLNSELYLNLKQKLEKWLNHPTYKSLGDLPLQFVLPDLLLPSVSQLLLHPGWLVGVKFNSEEKIIVDSPADIKTLELSLNKEASTLHDLRKTAKKARYNLEIFTQFYDANYANYLQKIEQVQEILGEIQDIYVLQAVLEQNLKATIPEEMPELATLLINTRYQKWQEWIDLQQQFLTESNRRELREIINYPGTMA